MSNDNNTFSVDLRMMADRTKKLNEELENMKRATAELTDQLMAMKALWNGAAANAFYQNIAGDVQLIENFIASGEKALEDHEYAIKTYREIEQRSVDIANAIRI